MNLVFISREKAKSHTMLTKINYVFLQAILIFVLSDWTPPAYGDYEFPLFADILGWFVGGSTLIFFPVGVWWALKNGYVSTNLL